MAVGADGVVSVASNIIPKEVSQMVRAFAEGDLRTALKIHSKFFSLFRNLFIESNPIPIKAALAMKGLLDEEYRLPLVKMQAKNRETLKQTLVDCGILK
jgi:4-hydroxy-tetrahydrodipicolinate synthase